MSKSAWTEEQQRLFDLLIERENRINKRLAQVEKQIEKAKHLSDVEFVNQNGRGK